MLHHRGHEIQFAVLKGWEKLLAPHPFVSKVHVVGRDLTIAEDDELYRLLDASSVSSAAGRRSMVEGISLGESSQVGVVLKEKEKKKRKKKTVWSALSSGHWSQPRAKD